MLSRISAVEIHERPPTGSFRPGKPSARSISAKLFPCDEPTAAILPPDLARTMQDALGARKFPRGPAVRCPARKSDVRQRGRPDSLSRGIGRPGRPPGTEQAMRRPFGLGFACALAWAGQASAKTLVINANTSDPAPRTAWEIVVADFQRDNPGVTVKFNIYDHESYKKSIRNWLTGAAPDVVFWFAGNRMREFVGRQLLTDVSDLFGGETQGAISRAGIDLVSVNGRQYGVPYSYYQVGLYFRRDLLKRAGLKDAPATWNDLLDACRTLKA